MDEVLSFIHATSPGRKVDSSRGLVGNVRTRDAWHAMKNWGQVLWRT